MTRHGAAEQGPAARPETPPAPGRQHREDRGRAGELQCGQAQRGPGRMLGGLGGEQDAVFHRPDQPGRRVGVAGPPPGVPEVRDVAGEAGQPGQHSPTRRRQEVTHRPTLARTRMGGALREAGRQRCPRPLTACAALPDGELADALMLPLTPRSEGWAGRFLAGIKDAEQEAGSAVKRSRLRGVPLRAGPMASMRIRADSASGTPRRSKISSACLSAIRAASGRRMPSVVSAMPSRILASS